MFCPHFNNFPNERQLLGSCSSLLTRILSHLKGLCLTTASPLGCCLLYCSYSYKTSQLALCSFQSMSMLHTHGHIDKLSPYTHHDQVHCVVHDIGVCTRPSPTQFKGQVCMQSSRLNRKVHVDKANVHTHTHAHSHLHTHHTHVH